MEIKLFRATINGAKELHAMQIEAFRELLDKYRDFDTNPRNESVEKAGAIQLCEEIHGNEEWEPDTIIQEPKRMFKIYINANKIKQLHFRRCIINAEQLTIPLPAIVLIPLPAEYFIFTTILNGFGNM